MRMKMNNLSMTVCLILVLFALLELGVCGRDDNFIRMKLGDSRDFLHPSANAHILSLARFAIQQHNERQNVFLKLARVLMAKEQVVAGKIYHLTLEVADAASRDSIYEAKVWVKPWINFKQLQEFNLLQTTVINMMLSFLVMPLLCRLSFFVYTNHKNHSVIQKFISRKHGNNYMMCTLCKSIVEHAINSIQQRCNSLFPYELLEVLLAKIKVIEDYIKFELLLKLRHGKKEENFKLKLLRTNKDSLL